MLIKLMHINHPYKDHHIVIILELQKKEELRTRAEKGLILLVDEPLQGSVAERLS